jgi:hypothetical protein
MGCFNKSCVITGLQITMSDPIVGIKLQKEKPSKYSDDSRVPFDHIHSEWYPIEFPVRGKYDDYGRIEVDGKLHEGDEDIISARCDDYMFIHEWAYDLIASHHEAERETYAKKGYTDWESKDWNSLQDTFVEMHNHKGVSTSNHKPDVLKRMCERTIRALSDRWLSGQLPNENRAHWFDKLYVDDYNKFRSNIERYQRELGFLEDNRFEMGFQWHPSYMANQVVDYDLRLKIIAMSGEYINSQMNYYDD